MKLAEIVEFYTPAIDHWQYAVVDALGYTLAICDHRSSAEKVLSRVNHGDARFALNG